MSYDKPISLLLAEADPTALELCSAIIKRRFPELLIHAVTSADDGIALFTQHKHDIVVSDVFFPHRGGIVLAKEACSRKPDTLILFLTGEHSLNKLLTDTDVEQLCLHCIVNKPLDVTELLLSIASAMTTINENRRHRCG